MTQTEILTAHLKRVGHISQREAIFEYSIQSLTRRIADLRKSGMKIKTVFKHNPVTGQRYARYTLSK